MKKECKSVTFFFEKVHMGAIFASRNDMKLKMNSEILIALIGAISTTVTGILAHFITKRKSQAETTSVEIDNVRKSNEILSEWVTKLNDETKGLRKEVVGMRQQISNLRCAIERIPLCAHAAGCPVAQQLQEYPDEE